ncbi:hypothetical protein B4143_3547 [Bacillus subtilis]|nr:hypothetical protein B4069_3983 [Bacillus subtilis]GAK81117.1 hypothetical protein BSMD_030320 [Bacillus subtilis Miyagi-4]KIO57537.1 hypothetical protein B4143_3547 [Bacillus subtilis]RAP07809.1 hypothetical protein HS3_01739 [Bacillus subtilis]RPK03930.1 hypothetical protein EH11_00334 [Bacillus subtilis]
MIEGMLFIPFLLFVRYGDLLCEKSLLLVNRARFVRKNNKLISAFTAGI